jgi:hypothetical protein
MWGFFDGIWIGCLWAACEAAGCCVFSAKQLSAQELYK